MTKLSNLIPLNLQEEKAKFFASGFKYNPQFLYRTNTPSNELTKHGKPKLWYLFLAKRILRKYLKDQKSSEQQVDDKKFLSQIQIEKLIAKRLSFYDLEHQYQVLFSNDFVSRIAVNNNDKIIKVRLPVMINEYEIEATFSHEIDTHVLRQLNYEKQPWFKKKKQHAFKPYLRTEEGLAVINELITDGNELAYKSAANYLAVDLALKNDFVAVFNFFYQIWQDAERSWTWTLKKKRGITDTSKKGAFTKDVVYFEGLIEVLNYLRKNNYDPSKLYYGKISWRDIQKAEKIGVKQELILPKLFTNNREKYMESVKTIAQANLIKFL